MALRVLVFIQVVVGDLRLAREVDEHACSRTVSDEKVACLSAEKKKKISKEGLFRRSLDRSPLFMYLCYTAVLSLASVELNPHMDDMISTFSLRYLC
ncbi:hypothetical protein L249_6224 [Ophiocordyceps polyrhachis-furcata BCC 54312]|uniref:Uncharacterized protein n=1 Tax=Ophiocordyceps polyrhachis-furcata BCC 54312 TaxID=1330021 RepID=A0A367L182_9HYPO|nr:hypothetical protein L249_6224 [Ophiocordyceps polyrhachis-furcata BCC 54312]